MEERQTGRREALGLGVEVVGQPGDVPEARGRPAERRGQPGGEAEWICVSSSLSSPHWPNADEWS